MSLLQGALLAPDSALPGQYMEALELERSAYPQLAPAARALSPAAGDAVARLEGLSAEWHARLNEQAVFDGGRGARAEILRRDLATYERALDAARDLDAALAEAARERRETIARTDSREMAMTVGMVLTALLSAAAVAWFARRVRTLAVEAAARREEAEATLIEMRAVSESRARLMRGITHDLKNPLGAADGYGELLQMGIEGELTPGQEKMVGGMRRSIRTVLQMIVDLLDFSRAESGELDLVIRPTDCREIVSEAVEQYLGSARAAGHDVQLIAPDGPLVAPTDRSRAAEVVGNLLSNAIKYTPAPGRIVVAVAESGSGRGPGPGSWIEIRVSDSGHGIPPSERERIFEEFHRLHHSGVAGHGLGLATSRRVADLLGGRLTVGDGEAGGAAFSLWLPTEVGFVDGSPVREARSQKSTPDMTGESPEKGRS
jgi:signal transduction histidine kinase